MSKTVSSGWENKQDIHRLRPSPKLVIAAGECACTGGEFGVSYASCGAVENVIPVDVKIPGCLPTPHALLRGILAAMEKT